MMIQRSSNLQCAFRHLLPAACNWCIAALSNFVFSVSDTERALSCIEVYECVMIHMF